ncbi:MAG: hypothetical protein NQU45_02335, partial [Methanothermobacter sp.]|nr:hypothetical protein [Methanothermobacter sp.]
MAEYIQPVRTMTESNSIAPGQDSIDVNPDHGGTPDKRTEYEMDWNFHKYQEGERISRVKSYIKRLIRLVEMEREAEINAMMNEIRRL